MKWQMWLWSDEDCKKESKSWVQLVAFSGGLCLFWEAPPCRTEEKTKISVCWCQTSHLTPGCPWTWLISKTSSLCFRLNPWSGLLDRRAGHRSGLLALRCGWKSVISLTATWSGVWYQTPSSRHPSRSPARLLTPSPFSGCALPPPPLLQPSQ